MSAKLRVLEHILLLETYTKDSIPALHKIRKYLVEATEEASIAYNKALIVRRLICVFAQRFLVQSLQLFAWISGTKNIEFVRYVLAPSSVDV
ncbi:AUGMIN subunit 4 isoform X2 [Arachis duranensis]|uniref:AUGMIN subunit 4 isoform X2 n=1 Tax=Arachis duranensis TaxID=130453 RepID=A0A9C6T7N8_ARADU|nr:AUGMIN subunit 4 isoform X2 [Arachis duranensis]